MANDRQCVLDYLGDVSTDLEKLRELLKGASKDVLQAADVCALHFRQLLTKVEANDVPVEDEPLKGVTEATANLLEFMMLSISNDPRMEAARELIQIISLRVESALAGSVWCL